MWVQPTSSHSDHRTELMTRGPWIHYSQLVASSIIELMIRYSWSGIQRPHIKELMIWDTWHRELISKSSWFDIRDTELISKSSWFDIRDTELISKSSWFENRHSELIWKSSNPWARLAVHPKSYHYNRYHTIPYPVLPCITLWMYND